MMKSLREISNFKILNFRIFIFQLRLIKLFNSLIVIIFLIHSYTFSQKSHPVHQFDVLPNEKVQNQNSNDIHLESFGLYFNYAFGFYHANFSKLPNVPNCCPSFTEGTGNGLAIGAIYESHYDNISISDYSFGLFYGIRGGINTISGVLKDAEWTLVQVNDSLVDGEFEHIIDSYFLAFSIEPLLRIKFNKLFQNTSTLAPMTISLGLNFSFNFSNEFRQRETISKPKDYGVFRNSQTRTRNDTSGIIKNMNILNLSPVARLSYELPLNNSATLTAEPEIFYNLGLINLISGLKWKVNSINIGVSIRYSPKEEAEPFYFEERKTEEHFDTIFVEKKNIDRELFKSGITFYKNDTLIQGDRLLLIDRISRSDTIFKPSAFALPDIHLDISAVGFDGIDEIPNVTMLIEEFRYTNIHPLLNFIFFNDNSSHINERYIQLDSSDIEDFRIDKLFGTGRLNTYYNVLNIIASRMKEYPNAKITLTGCNSGMGNEENNLGLSKERANAVAQYLIRTWKIPEKRIIIKAANLPKEPSNIDTEDGIAENRRVEITSDTPEITAHVFTNDTLRVSTPPQIRFIINCAVDSGSGGNDFKTNDSIIKNWSLIIEQNGKILKTFSGNWTIPYKIEWNLNVDKSSIPGFSEPLVYKLSVIDKWNREFKTETKIIELELKTIMDKHLNREGDKKIDHYSFLLFDFDKKNLNKKNLPMINLINSRIEKESDIIIEGYTDRIGEENYNLELSVGRALSVSKALKSPKTIYKGYGESKLLYDNSLPEGRFYSRTVEVTIETPIKD